MVELTEQQQHALDVESTPRLVDPRDQKTYFLIGSDLFNRIQPLLVENESVDMQQVALLVDCVMRDEDADDPTLAFYQEKYGSKP